MWTKTFRCLKVEVVERTAADRARDLSLPLAHCLTVLCALDECARGYETRFTDVSRKVTFPERRFPENHFPGKIVCHCFNVKQTLTVFCVNWRIILLTGLLSLIREVMQHGPALLIFTLSALSDQVPAHHVGPICSRRV